MYVCERTEFADATPVVGAAGMALIGDVVDLTVARDIGNGQPGKYLVITTDTEIITAGAAGTLTFSLVSDAQPAIAVDGSATVHATTRAYVTGTAAANSPELNAGGVIAILPLPWEGVPYERYLGVICTVGTTAVSAGKINAFITAAPFAWKATSNGIPPV